MSERYSNENIDVSVLGKPVKLASSGLTAPNVFLKAAMTERLSSWDQHDPSKRGTPSDELIRLYEEWGKGGYGIILSGNVIVDPMNLEATGNPVFHRSVTTPHHTEQWQRLATAAKAGGSLFIVQLSHGGRQTADFIQPNPVSASDIQLGPSFGMTFAKPHSATKEEIKEITEDFAYAAEYAHKIGADGVQLHGAHGYLIAQFLAESTNTRTDEYGGSLHNRARLLYEIIEAIKARVNDPKFSIAIKLNSVEFQRGGLQTEEAAEICNKLNELGLDWVELSGGTYEKVGFEHKRESTKAREGFFLEFADLIKPRAGNMKIWVTGGFRTAKAMVDAINQGSTDGIGLARPISQELDLPKKILNGEVSSAVKSALDPSDYGISLIASGVQMRQAGKGIKPFDTSDEKQVNEFQENVGKFFQKLAEDGAKGVINAGFPDLAGAVYN